MFKQVFDRPALDVKVRKLKKVDLHRVAAIDQYDAQPFNISESGHIANDITSLARAQSKQEFDMILSRLQQIEKSNELPQTMSDKERISLVRSRYTQSPTELMRFAEQLAHYDADKIDDAYRKALADSEVNKQVETPKSD